eukprot:1176807-Prorocentrum_minimum.AAC.7
MYTGASCGTWISPRNQYVAHGACSWESWMFSTMGTPRFGLLCPSRAVQHTLKTPLVVFTISRVDYEAAEGRTALIAAAEAGSVAALEALVKQGAKVDYETLYRKTALIVAAEKPELPAVRAPCPHHPHAPKSETLKPSNPKTLQRRKARAPRGARTMSTPPPRP